MLRNNCFMVKLLLSVLLLLSCAINRIATFESKRSAGAEADDADDALTVEAHAPPVTVGVHRHVRQLFYEPNLIFVSSVGVSAVAEGGKCSTTFGMAGQCVRIDQCQAYYRVSPASAATETAAAARTAPQQQQKNNAATEQKHQRQQLFYPNVQQWWQPPQPQPQHPPSAFDALTPVGNGNEICTFYDQLGRVNNGICCAFGGYGEFDVGAWPLPTPPTAGAVTPPTPPAEGEVELIEPVVDNSGVQRPVVGQAAADGDGVGEHVDVDVGVGDGERDKEPVDDVPDNADVAPDFNVEQDNHIVYDPIKDDPDFEASSSTYNGSTASPALTPVTYHDVRYPWPQHQFIGQFGGVALPQWPPPLPTHPPSAASWPPPIPTHPPNHHYPTHPPAITRPPTAITPQATKRPPSGGAGAGAGAARPTTPTTTRRPATTTAATTTRRPSYPSYPGFPPGFPTYPTYRPAYRPPATNKPAATTTTTRRPATGGAVGVGTSAHGLPLQCGIRNPISPDQERIVGGTNASPYEFPWIAVLFKAGKQFCGGSLITHSHVLTAAHCVARMTSWDVAALTVHLGDYNIRTDFEVKHVERRVKRLVRHKGFDFSHLHNDIAILTLSEPVKFTYEIQPICLPTSSTQQSRSYSGHLATVAGWGSLRESGPQPAVLQKVDIPIWSNLDCARKYGHAAPGGIIDSMVCAGTLSKDSCSGDSGGPLIVRDDGGRYTQVGIVSWGIGCGKGQYPGVYTRVTALLSWIYKNIKM